MLVDNRKECHCLQSIFCRFCLKLQWLITFLCISLFNSSAIFWFHCKDISLHGSNWRLVERTFAVTVVLLLVGLLSYSTFQRICLLFYLLFCAFIFKIAILLWIWAYACNRIQAWHTIHEPSLFEVCLFYIFASLWALVGS